MARDTRIDYAKRKPQPVQQVRDLTTSERVQLLVLGVLIDVSARLNDRRTINTTSRKP